MRRSILRLAFLAAAFLPAACRAPDIEPRPGHAMCPVCRCNGDLACLDVTITPNTPTAVVDGVTYYFCSEACRDDFLREPVEFEGR